VIDVGLEEDGVGNTVPGLKIKLIRIICVVGASLLIATPGQTEERLGLGRTVSDEEIKLWDIDVMPNGTGLPAGSGTVPEGEKVYRAKCISCHGEGGVGGTFDQLVGRVEGDAFPFGKNPAAKKTIGNYWPYATTLFDYIRRAMPFTEPNSLSDQEVYSLTAYLLHLNEIVDKTVVMDAEVLKGIEMPARHRFVHDDRTSTENFR
jgi:cytochrome c